MSDRVPPIARIRLSRSLPRLLALPLIVLLAGAGAIGTGLMLVDGVPGFVLAGLGALAILTALVGVAVLLSIRLDVEEAAVRVSWLGGERVHPLTPGPVTRVRFRGENASPLRSSGLRLGWQLGAAILRDEEPIQVVRLAATPTAILVPTEDGRLAIAAADEGALLDALSRAARARQRLDDLARTAPAPEEPAAPPRIEVDPALMTGIERAMFERREAEDRAAAGALETSDAATVREPSGEREDEDDGQVDTEPRGRRRLRLTIPRPRWSPGPSPGLLLLPLVGAGVAWGGAVLLGRMPEPGTDLGRLTALGFVLAGPATTVGAIMARVWWPRLVGVVVASGLVAAVFVGRSLLG